MPERVESGQTEFDECHQAKVSGTTDIQQINMSSDPNTTMNFSASQLSTQLSEHLQRSQTSSITAIASTYQSSMVTQSSAQLMKDLNYTILRVNSTSTVKAKLKELTETKSDDEQKTKVKIDGNVF